MPYGLQRYEGWDTVLIANDKKRLPKLKLQWKVFMFLLGFCGLLLFVLWIFQIVLLPDMYKMIRLQQIESAMARVEEAIDSPQLESILYDLKMEDDIQVNPIKEFSPPPRGPEKMETLTQTRLYTRQDGSQIQLVFHATITPVEATTETLKVQLYLMTLMMVVLSIGLALIIAKRVAKPIEHINKRAKKLAQGDYAIHFEAEDFIEIKELSDTLNIAATELSKNESLRRELMANISHDLRTPLALIYSYAEMMHDFPQEITSEQTKVIMDETSRLSSLVSDILKVSKLEAGVEMLQCEHYNLTHNLKQTIERMAELVRKDNSLLEFDYTEEVMVYADAGQIMQVFYNLLLNAVTYSEPGQVVLIRQIRKDDRVRVEVTDTGGGIDEAYLPDIWDRYYKVKQTHKRGVAGTGLGLSIVKKIIDAHGGLYGVVSQQGVGSTFWFELKIDGPIRV